MSQRSRIAWLPILLGLYLLAIIAYIVFTRGATLAAVHPAYPLTLGVVALGAIVAIVVALVRARRG
ncbi:MAG TPA: hypothetical protein VIL85_28435 [Thermomicrobiales bacterium]|jgi:hypothetical protein